MAQCVTITTRRVWAKCSRWDRGKESQSGIDADGAACEITFRSGAHCKALRQRCGTGSCRSRSTSQLSNLGSSGASPSVYYSSIGPTAPSHAHAPASLPWLDYLMDHLHPNDTGV